MNGELTATIDAPLEEVTEEQTPPNDTDDVVELPGEPSAVIWRLYAAMFDVAIVLGPALLAGWVGGTFLAVLVGLALLVGQLVLQGRRGWTLAQRQMSLQLVDHSTGEPVGTLRATQRLFLVALGGIMVGVGAVVVMISPLYDRTGQGRGWHDLLTGTTVLDLGVPRPTKARAAVPAGLDEAGPRPALLMWRLYSAMFDVAMVGTPFLVAVVAVSGPSGVVLGIELAFLVLVVQIVLQGQQGWSLGQRIVALRLVDGSTGAPVGAGRAMQRLLVVAASGLVGGVGALVVLVSPRFDRSGRRRGWHDMAVGAQVLDLWVAPPVGLPPTRVRQPRASDLPVRAEPSALIWRMYAAVLDMVVVLGPALLVAWVANAFLGVVTGVAVLVVQLVLQGRYGWTLAQLMVFVRVVDRSTHTPVGAGRAAQRLFVVALGGLVGGVGALIVVSSAQLDGSGRRRGWHDLLAGTEVLDVWETRPEFEDTRSRQIMEAQNDHRPMTAELGLPGGATRKVTGTVVIGRNPIARPSETVLRLSDESLAPNHLRLTIGPLAVWVEDLGAASGTCIRLPDGTHEACLPGKHVQVPAGSVIEIGDAQVQLRKVIV